LLLPFDWACNISPSELVRQRYRQIVPIGRVKWFADSP
jgi:hypothetical protein